GRPRIGTRGLSGSRVDPIRTGTTPRIGPLKRPPGRRERALRMQFSRQKTYRLPRDGSIDGARADGARKAPGRVRAPGGSEPQEGAEQALAVAAEERLRMELHPPQGQAPVAHGLNLPLVGGIHAPGDRDQVLRKAL